MVALAADHGLEPYYRRELIERFRATDRATRRRGREWYPTARELMVELAARTGYSLDQAVAVLAITSPQAQLRTNIEWTSRALESRGAARVGRFPNAMGPKIAAVLADPEYAAEYVSGPKVGPFFRAILGDNALVLDRWALYAATNTGDRDELHSMRESVREAIVTAYHRAAKVARMRVRDFQAAVWIQTRETTPVYRRGQWSTIRLVDITAA